MHDLSVDNFSERCVFARGRGINLNIDCHRGGKPGRRCGAVCTAHDHLPTDPTTWPLPSVPYAPLLLAWRLARPPQGPTTICSATWTTAGAPAPSTLAATRAAARTLVSRLARGSTACVLNFQALGPANGRWSCVAMHAPPVSS